MKKLLTLFILVSLMLTGRYSRAAQISIKPPVNVSVGDEFIIPIYLDTGKAVINAAELTVLYPPIIRIKNISKSGSALELWVKEPSFTDSAVLLSGGVPGGVSGDRLLIATITAEAVAAGSGVLDLAPSSEVLLNDGSGTSAPLSLNSQTFNISPRKANQPAKTTDQVPQAQTATSDITPPNSFSLSIGHDARLFNGKYFVSFFTTDSGTGVDHYEIEEGSGPFKFARSPYLLSDQSLHTVIRVRAYDGAGNYRESVYPGIFVRFWWWITGLLKTIGL